MKEIIIEKLMEQLDLERDEIKMDSSFVDDFEMDSLDMVEMLIELEKETGIKIPNEEVKGIKTVGELLAYLEGKQNA
ncbi:MAG: acyl carrier protein [Christensenellales bacterium]|jgi:acyl carrier protein